MSLRLFTTNPGATSGDPTKLVTSGNPLLTQGSGITGFTQTKQVWLANNEATTSGRTYSNIFVTVIDTSTSGSTAMTPTANGVNDTFTYLVPSAALSSGVIAVFTSGNLLISSGNYVISGASSTSGQVIFNGDAIPTSGDTLTVVFPTYLTLASTSGAAYQSQFHPDWSMDYPTSSGFFVKDIEPITQNPLRRTSIKLRVTADEAIT